MSLVIVLSLRLFTTSQFGGSWADLNFGHKDVEDDEVMEPEDNMAFEPEFNSYGHCFQVCVHY